MGNIHCFSCRTASSNNTDVPLTGEVAVLGQPAPGPQEQVQEQAVRDDGGEDRQSNYATTITTNALLPPAPVVTDSIAFKSLELMMQDVQLLGEVGSGGSATVYKGVYQGGDVAVKLAVVSSMDPGGLREALVSPQLRHPHVVHTYVTRGALLTQEYIERVCCPLGPTASATGRVELPAQLPPSLPSCPSGDGLGAPRKFSHERQGWADVLMRVGALPNRCLLMLVMELCDHGNLARAIRRGVFSAALRVDGGHDTLVARRILLRTASEVCRGMIHLHIASLVHGDLKPGNILLCRSRSDRRGFVAKVADFGLSHLLNPDHSHVDSSNWGTIAYASPESLKGKHARSSDVYSFGMILWEMLTGVRPYENMPAVRILMAVSYEDLRPTWPPDVWPELVALGQRCLAADPDRRPSFKELEEQLVALEEGLRVQSKRRMAADPEITLKPRGPTRLAGGHRLLGPAPAATAAASHGGHGTATATRGDRDDTAACGSTAVHPTFWGAAARPPHEGEAAAPLLEEEGPALPELAAAAPLPALRTATVPPARMKRVACRAPAPTARPGAATEGPGPGQRVARRPVLPGAGRLPAATRTVRP